MERELGLPEGFEQKARRLHEAWTAAAVAGADVVGDMPEPGPIALRARFWALRQVSLPTDRPESFRTGWDDWWNELMLESRGDTALISNDLAIAAEAYEELARIGRIRTTHPVVLIQALIGLADVARHHDDTETAAKIYDEAYALAVTTGSTFGRVRVLVPKGHLLRRAGAAEEMLTAFVECEREARVLGDRIYIANALVGRGEALGLLGQHDEAVKVLSEAVENFQQLGSSVGVASAAIRLADVLRMADRKDEAMPVLQLVIDLEDGPVVEAIDAADVLAELYNRRGEYAAARRTSSAAIERAREHGYPRSVAHLQMTLGHCERLSGSPGEAAELFAAALDYFQRRADDLAMSAYCLGDLALCAEDAGDLSAAVDLRLRSITSIEQMRARQTRPRFQAEYRQRFGRVYRGALRTAVVAQDPAAFVAVFEGLWGRRLAGLTGKDLKTGSDPVVIAQLLARAERNRWRRTADQELDPAERFRRVLGGAALAGALPEMFDDSIGAELAAAYSPFDPTEAQGLLTRIPDDVAALLLAPVPEQRGEIAWLARTPQGEITLGTAFLPAVANDLLDVAVSRGMKNQVVADVAPFAALVPSSISELPVGTRLQLVPLEDLWALPWSAVPAGHGMLLGEQFAVLTAPSLTVADVVRSRSQGADPKNLEIRTWIGPEVNYHRLAGLRGTATAVAGPEEALREIVATTVDAVVVVAHGRPAAALGHYLELGEEVLLTPADLFTAATPRRLGLIACWGAQVPGGGTGDPLTFATLALTRSSDVVVARVSELGDDAVSSAFVDSFLYRAMSLDWPEALRRTTAERRSDILYQWATLTILGSW
ncbi:tetratricopeptide repeat protein [Kribbella endophytica]